MINYCCHHTSHKIVMSNSKRQREKGQNRYVKESMTPVSPVQEQDMTSNSH